MRRDEAVGGWRNWLREDALVGPYRRLRPALVLPAPFLQILVLLLVALGFWPILLGSTNNSVKLGFPNFCCSGQREASLGEFDAEVEDWLPLLPEVHLPP